MSSSINLFGWSYKPLKCISNIISRFPTLTVKGKTSISRCVAMLILLWDFISHNLLFFAARAAFDKLICGDQASERASLGNFLIQFSTS